ncbi:MAG: rhodanese-like domain-containing protein [Ignavibacteriales bacterium]|nr:rhodanese-like domain-containing protein [Ignavibacteriales bacterium]
MKIIPLVFLSVMFFAVAAHCASTGPSEEPGLLVRTEWLAQHLGDKDIVILHAHWTNSSYKQGHIPGARFLWLYALAKNTPERSTELPSIQEARAVLKDLGITRKSRIVVYVEGQNTAMASRMILTLAYFGLEDRVVLLDGGLDAWKKEGRPVSKEIPKFKPGTYVPKPHTGVVRDAEWVRAHLTDPNVTIIDARARRYYDGSTGTSPGHLPHAVSIPASSVADSTNRMISLDSLRSVFGRAGVKPGSRLVAYCHVGQSATLVYLAARMIGYDVSVYDGSFEDWADRELPVEAPPAKK